LTEGANDAIEGLDETMGAKDGWLDNVSVGARETDGRSEGETPLGSCVILGRFEGERVGRLVGERVGLPVGSTLGLYVGEAVG
jgi:hypothetical protein